MAKKKGTTYINAAISSKDQGNSQITKISFGRGDHCKISGYDKNGNPIMAVIPVNLQGNGTECKIIKILKALGVIIVLSGILIISICLA